MQYRSVHVWPNRLGIQIKAKKKFHMKDMKLLYRLCQFFYMDDIH